MSYPGFCQTAQTAGTTIVNDKYRSRGRKPDADIDRPNISTENQPEGAAGRPSDTLDREPDRDPQSGGAIPPDYNPRTMTRKGEEKDTAVGRERNPDRR